MKRTIISFLASLLLPLVPAFSQKKQISLEQVWKTFDFYPVTSYQTYDLPHSEYYLQIKDDTLFTKNYLNAKNVSKITDFKDTSNFVINPRRYWINKPANMLLTAVDCEQIYRRSYSARYLLYDVENRSYSKLFGDSLVQAAQFSPCGKQVCFVYRNNLYVKNADTVQQVTFDGERNKIINGIPDWVYEEEFEISDAYEWSGDCRYIAYLKFDESAVKQAQLAVYSSLYPEQYVYKYPKAGERNSTVSLWVYDLKTARSKCLANAADEGFEYIPRLQWKPGTDECVFYLLNRKQSKLKVMSVSVSSGNRTVLFEEEADTYLEIGSKLHFYDGGFAVLSDSGEFTELLNDKQSVISPENMDVTEVYGYNAFDRCIYFQLAVSPMQRQVYKYSIDEQKRTQISRGNGFHSVRLVAGGKYLIEEHSSHKQLPQFSLLNTDGELLRVLEDNAESSAIAAQYKLPEREFFSFVTERGDTLNGWKMVPQNNKKKKLPLLITVYGGPSHQTVTDSWDYSYYWQAALVQKGYAVVSVDCRGTEGRGNAFKKQTYGKLGLLEAEDFISAARYFAGQKYIDPQRIAIQGWSYGGYMSLLSLGLSENVFKAGIAIAPVTNWLYYDNIYAERYMNLPLDNLEAYKTSSCMAYAQNIDEALLMVHGSFDDNVHVQNSHEMAKELIKLDKAFDYMIYPDRNHGIYGDNARLHLFKMMFKFIDDNL